MCLEFLLLNRKCVQEYSLFSDFGIFYGLYEETFMKCEHDLLMNGKLGQF